MRRLVHLFSQELRPPVKPVRCLLELNDISRDHEEKHMHTTTDHLSGVLVSRELGAVDRTTDLIKL